jgi:hypothetical protein
MPLDEVHALIQQGVITDVLTVTAILRVLLMRLDGSL